MLEWGWTGRAAIAWLVAVGLATALPTAASSSGARVLRLTVAGNARGHSAITLGGATIAGVVYVAVPGAHSSETLALDRRRLGVVRARGLVRLDTRRVRDGRHTLTARHGTHSVSATFTVANHVRASDLIQTAYALHEIDYGTSLIDRMYAMWGDAALPRALRGRGGGGRDEGVYRLAFDALRKHRLPAREVRALSGFLRRPDARGSFLTPHRRGRRLSGGAADACALAGSWVSSAGSQVRGWAPSGDPGAKGEARLMSSVGDVALSEEEKDMGRPVLDQGSPACADNPDDRVDVFLVNPAAASARGGLLPGVTAGTPWPATSALGVTIPTAVDADRCTAFVLINRDAASTGGVLDPDKLEATLNHELYHVLQEAHDCFTDSWFVEASAEWAVTNYSPSSSGLRDNQLWFSNFQARQPTSLEPVCMECNQAYQDWMYPLFMSQEGVDPSAVWRSMTGERSPLDVLDAIDREFPWDSNFHLFAVRDLNVHYNEQDGSPGKMFSSGSKGVALPSDIPAHSTDLTDHLPLTTGATETLCPASWRPAIASSRSTLRFASSNWTSASLGPRSTRT